MKASRDKLAGIREVADLLKGGMEPDRLFHRIVETARDNLGFDKVLLSILNKQTGLFERKASTGLDPDEFDRLFRQQVSFEYYKEFLKDEYRVGSAYFIGHEQSLTNGEYACARSGIKGRRRRAWHSEDILLVPLYLGNHGIIGMLSVDKPRDGRVPSRQTITALEIFAEYAAMAIQHAAKDQQLMRQVAHLTTLYDVGKTLTSVLALDELLEEVVNIIQNTFHYLWVIVFLLDEETGELVPRAHAGFEKAKIEGLRIPARKGEGITGTVAASKRPMIVKDLKKFKGSYIKVRDGARSEIAVPIIIRNKTIGVIDIESETPGQFTKEDLSLLQQLAGQLAVAIENARHFERQELQLAQRTALLKVSHAINSVLDLDQLLKTILDILRTTFNLSTASILLPREDNETILTNRAYIGYDEELLKNIEIRIGEKGVTGLAAKTGKPILVEDVSCCPYYVTAWRRAQSELALPLKRGDRVIGVLNLESDRRGFFKKEDLPLFEIFADQISVAIENARLYEQTLQLAVTDGLTGLFNHRYFREQIVREIRRGARLSHPVSLIMIDIDHFKNYNDTLGHPMGDIILSDLAAILRRSVRQHIDTVARYGGEEFAIILPEIPKHTAIRIAERIRKEIMVHRFMSEDIQPGGHLTISAGVASFPDDAKNPEDLIRYADEALYSAKHAGRNRVCAAQSCSHDG